MNEPNRDVAIAAAVTLLCEMHRQQSTEEMFQAYITGLDGIPLKAIERAVNLSLKTSTFMPKAVELREMAGEMRSEDRAQHAWIVVERCVRRLGAYKTVRFDDIVINATIRSLGGWIRVCETDAAEFDTHLRREFIKTYTSLNSSGVGEEHAAPLIGIFDQINSRNGFPMQRVKNVVTGLPPAAPTPRLNAPQVPKIEGRK